MKTANELAKQYAEQVFEMKCEQCDMDDFCEYYEFKGCPKRSDIERHYLAGLLEVEDYEGR